MTEPVDFPAPVYPPSVTDHDPATFPSVPCDVVESHSPHVWIGAWDRGDEDPRRCPGRT